MFLKTFPSVVVCVPFLTVDVDRTMLETKSPEEPSSHVPRKSKLRTGGPFNFTKSSEETVCVNSKALLSVIIIHCQTHNESLFVANHCKSTVFYSSV